MRERVIFITGYARSGSTVLGDLLARKLGGIHVGEVFYLPDRGARDQWLCSCGQYPRSCQIWRKVLDDLPLGLDDVDEWLRDRAACRTRYLLWGLPAPSRRFVRRLRRLYSLLHEHGGCRPIVDSSKYPAYGYVLASQVFPGRVHVLHLIRDLPQVALSQKYRVKTIPTAQGEILMERAGVLRTSLHWSVLNYCAAKLTRVAATYTLLRYEEFVQEPEQCLKSICARVGGSGGKEGLSHVFSGNPGRLEAAGVVLQGQDKSRLGFWEKRVANLVCKTTLRALGQSMGSRTPCAR